MPVHISRCVAIQPIHDVLKLRVQPVDDRVKGHPVLGGENDQLEVGVADLGQEHVDAGTFLKSPTVFVLKLHYLKHVYDFQNFQVV